MDPLEIFLSDHCLLMIQREVTPFLIHFINSLRMIFNVEGVHDVAQIIPHEKRIQHVIMPSDTS